MAVGWFFGCKRFGDICKNFGRLGLAKCRFVRPSRRMILGRILGPCGEVERESHGWGCASPEEVERLSLRIGDVQAQERCRMAQKFGG